MGKVISNITRDNRVITQDSVLCALKLIGTEKSLQMFNELSSGRLPEVEVNPCDYNTAYAYMLDAQAKALYSKCAYADFGIDTRQAAIDVWHSSERKCKEYNSLLRQPSYLRDLSKNVTGIIYHAHDYLRRLLGPVPSLTQLRFGPGSTAHSRGFKGSLPNKLENDTGVYKHTQPRYYMELIKANPAFAYSLYTNKAGEPVNIGQVKPIDHDIFDTVPKTAKVDRGISYGASLNMCLQLGVHDFIIARLKRWGVDLPHLPDLHKKLAQQASLDGSLATIDLKAASDSISLELVRHLLPYEWFCFLDNLRAKRTEVDGTVHELEKFCAMGCGFTFALETIIFMAIAWATSQLEGVKKPTISVFGDDIIVDTVFADQLISNLGYLGFETNKDKTFTTGPFRESCGGDFFNGIPVRPTYIKDIPDGIEGLYALANRLREVSRNISLGGYCSLDYRTIWESVISYIPENVRFFGPSSCGDTVITSTREEWIGQARYSNEQLRIPCLGRAYQLKGRARPKKQYGKLAYALYKLGMCETESSTPFYLRKLSASLTDDGQIMSSTDYSLVKRNINVYYTVVDESFGWC